MENLNKEQNRLRQRKNFLQEQSAKVLSLAKRTEHKGIRSRVLKLYFNQQRDLREVIEQMKGI